MNGLRYIRIEVLHATYDRLAKMLNVSKQAVYAWESGKKKMPEERICQLEKLLGIPKKYFSLSKVSDVDKLEIKKYVLSAELAKTEKEIQMKNSKMYRIAVTWEAAGFIEVEADSIEEAMNKVKENPDDYPLPYDGGDYVDGSFRLSTDDVEEMKLICG